MKQINDLIIYQYVRFMNDVPLYFKIHYWAEKVIHLN